MPYARRAPSPYEMRVAAPWLRATATACDIEFDELLQHNWRDMRVSILRAVIVVLIHDARMTPAQVARLLQRDHTTILHHERLAAEDRLAQEFMAAIRTQHHLDTLPHRRRVDVRLRGRRGDMRQDAGEMEPARPALEVVTHAGRPALTLMKGGAV